MQIAILAHGLRGGGGTSVGQNLLAAFSRIAPRGRYFVSIPRSLGFEEICARFGDVTVLTHSARNGALSRLKFECVELPRALSHFRPDFVFGFGGYGVVGAPYPQAILCHNPYLFYPARHFGYRCGWDRAALHVRLALQSWQLRRDLCKSRFIMCQTETAANRLRQQYGYRGQVVLCPNSVSEFTMIGGVDVSVPEALQRSPGKLKLLYVTRYYPHKNLEAIVDAFRAFRDELREVVVVLTIAAEQHRNAKRLLGSIRDFNLDEQIVNVGPVPQRDLAGYYRNCDALLMPTLLESFSGTYFEAMHFGLPILTSALDFSREVCGDAALYFDPFDARSIRDAILGFRADAALRSTLVERGRERLSCQQRSWDDIVTAVLCEARRHVGTASFD